MKTKTGFKKPSSDFLLDCVFGQHEDLIAAAIDKAYADMAVHWLVSGLGSLEIRISSIGFSKKTDSAVESFNKNMEEIIYLFEKNHVDVVFIEDLDRYLHVV